ncbi:MAG TPA: LuxR C-terminal-related transcriptional regulator [Sphingopyxis sp.]|nr:LuxR C-terminal-related transcriptional regulator [Sphingopyxis sp.]
MSACLALEPVKTLDAGLPALSGRLGQVRTRKDAFDLLACFLREQGLSDLILTFIPPGDLANQAVQWSTLTSETSDRLRDVGFDGRDPVRRLARRSIEPFVWDSSEWRGERSTVARDMMAHLRKAGIEGGASVAVWGRGGRVAIADAIAPQSVFKNLSPSFLDLFFAATVLTVRTIERLSLIRGNTPLTRREIEILELAEQGLTNGTIGALLDIVEETVKFHFRGIREKLNVRSRADAITRFAVLDASWSGRREQVSESRSHQTDRI